MFCELTRYMDLCHLLSRGKISVATFAEKYLEFFAEDTHEESAAAAGSPIPREEVVRDQYSRGQIDDDIARRELTEMRTLRKESRRFQQQHPELMKLMSALRSSCSMHTNDPDLLRRGYVSNEELSEQISELQSALNGLASRTN